MFSDIQSKIIDRKIYEWVPDLKKLSETNLTEMKVTINTKKYNVKYLERSQVYIFKDITYIEHLNSNSVNRTPTVGIITIDNYQDVANMLDDSAVNDALTSTQTCLVDYAKKFNLLIKKYKNDSYIFICNKADYERLKKDKFSILDQVREATTLDGRELTLSIGVSSGDYNYRRLFENCNTALDVALSRGGNQVVVSMVGEKLQFIGGTTEVKEKRSSVESRSFAKTMMAYINESTSIYIMGHAEADLDAIGGALGMYAFAKACNINSGTPNKRVKIIYDENNVETKTRKAFRELFTKEEAAAITIPSIRAVDDINSKSLLIVVDVHNPDRTMAPNVAKKATRTVVVDHHRLTDKTFEKTLLNHMILSASSTSEIVTEMIHFSSIPVSVSPAIATFMLAGILLDSNYYRNKIGARTYNASYILKEFGADNSKADSFLKVDLAEQRLKLKIMNNYETPTYGIIINKADSKDIVDRSILAIVAQETLQISEINACFVIGRISDKEIGISARSDGNVNCQVLLEFMGGGGSFDSAGATLRNTTIEAVDARLKDVLSQHLNEARQKKVGEE